MDLTSDDGAAVKLIIIVVILGLGIIYSIQIIYKVTYLICNGCWFFIRHFFIMLASIMRILILFNLITIVMLSQKYYTATNNDQKTKARKNLGASCFMLWILCVLELNFGDSNNQSLFQIMAVFSFIIGIIFYLNPHKSATFRQIKSSSQQCPICMDDIKNGIRINQCQHSICNECIFNYIHHSIIDITKYPIKCFQHECNTKIHKDVIYHIINNQIKLNTKNNENPEKLQQLLSKYDRFSLITSTPKHLRIDCPNAKCQNILLKNQPPLSHQFDRDKYPSFTDPSNGTPGHYKPPYSVKKCSADLCMHTFSMLKWRYNCTICGDVFCYQCIRFKMQILELDYIEPINLCMTCFTNLFCIQCDECKQMICYRCEQPWHNVCDKDDNINGICKMIKANDKSRLLDAKTRKMMRNSKFQKCPKCGMMIEKESGCNHITHKGCPYKTEFNGTHFCYTCGELLYGRYHNAERDGTRHFPHGVYKDCRKVKKGVQNCIVM